MAGLVEIDKLRSSLVCGGLLQYIDVTHVAPSFSHWINGHFCRSPGVYYFLEIIIWSKVVLSLGCSVYSRLPNALHAAAQTPISN